MHPTSLVIGDPHFKTYQKNSGRGADFDEFIDKITDIAIKKKPTFIVILGDILDSHETVKVQAHKFAERMIENLSAIAPTYILIGNHDYINNSQFLTSNHIFTPFKKWKNVFIADTVPLVLELNVEPPKTFIFCPYTPPGKFVEALDTVIPMGYDWNFVDCIFAHQEFKGCNLGCKISTKGDEWDSDYPPVISGHIHEESIVGDNVFYIGTPIQQTFAESVNKKVWFITWHDHDDQDFSIEKIGIPMKQKKCLRMTAEEILGKEYDKHFRSTLAKYNLKIDVSGASDELKAFRKSQFARILKNDHKVLIVYSVTGGNTINSTAHIYSGKSISYRNIFNEGVRKLNENARTEYKIIFDRDLPEIPVEEENNILEENEIVELVFVE